MSKLEDAIDAAWQALPHASDARVIEHYLREHQDEVASDVEKLRGDLHHLIAPIIGTLRRAHHYDEWDHIKEWAETYIDRLYLVLNLVDEAATGNVVPDEKRGLHGVGLNHYPTLAHADASPCVTTPHSWFGLKPEDLV